MAWRGGEAELLRKDLIPNQSTLGNVRVIGTVDILNSSKVASKAKSLPSRLCVSLSSVFHMDPTVAGINALPVELLAQFFEQALVPIAHDLRHKRNPQLAQVVVFSLVCRQWRAVTLGTARLWNNVIADLDDDPEVLSEYSDAMSRRVGGAPVHLRIIQMDRWLQDYDESTERARIRIFFDVDAFPNVASLTFAGKRGNKLEDMLSLVQDFPRQRVEIETLRIAGFRKAWWAAQEIVPPYSLRFVGLFRDVRRLEVNKVPKFAMDGPLQTEQLPSIRSVHFSDVMQLDIAAVFRQCPNLEHASVRGCPKTHVLAQDVDVPKLKSLELYGYPDTCLDIGRLHCPSLVTFESDFLRERNVTGRSWAKFLRFLKDSPSIVELDLLVAAGVNLVAIGHLPLHIVHLRLDYPPEYRGALLGTSSTGSFSIFPSLRSLEVTNRNFLTVDDFESFVCGACLPPSHPQCRRQREGTIIETLVVDAAGSWSRSDLLGSATYLFRHILDGSGRTKLRMSWV